MMKKGRQKVKWISKQKNRAHFRPLYIFNTRNRFHEYVSALVRSNIFEYFILTAVLTSCILLVVQGPNQSSSNISDPYTIADFTLNIIFSLEALLKIITYGFVLHKGAYLRSSWNVFDFIVVLTGSISDALVLSKSVNKSFSLKFIRLFRILRPLRLIAKSENLKVVLDTIIKSFLSVFHVLMFMLLIILLYAVSGVELFGGLLHTACYNGTTGHLVEPLTICKPSELSSCSQFENATCEEKWPSMKGNMDITPFDNIEIAMRTVLQVITMEDWVFIVYKLNVVSSPFITWIYFVTLILFGAYFAVDLLMGVLGNQFLRTKAFIKNVNKLKKCKSVEDGSSMDNISVEFVQNNAAAASIIMQPASRLSWLSNIIAKSEWYQRAREASKKVTKTHSFFWFMSVTIVIDVVVTSVYAHLSKELDITYSFVVIKSILLVVYFGEGVMNMLAIRPKKSITHGYFVLNSVICIVSFIELVTFLITRHIYIGLSVVRAVGLIQIFRETRFWTQLSSVIRTFVESIKGISGLVGLLFVVLTNYALLGNQIFGRPLLDRNSIGTFDNFGSSLLLSFVLLTGDNWVAIMVENMELSSSSTHKVITVIFFTSFVVVGNFILMNVFLGIIVENLSNDLEEHDTDRKKPKHKLKLVELISALSTLPNNKVASAEGMEKTTGRAHDIHEEGHTGCSQMGSSFELKNSFNQLFNEIQLNKDRITENRKKNTRSESSTIRFELNRRARVRNITVLFDPEIAHPMPQHKSLFLFSHKNKFRQAVFVTVTNSEFIMLVCFAVVLSSLILAFNDPLRQDTLRMEMVTMFENIFTGFFAIEIFLKAVAYGFVFGHRKCFLRDAMNVVDALVVIISLVNISLRLAGYENQNSLRILRVVRLVRMLKVSKRLKEVINCLVNSVQKIGYFLVLYFLVLFVYSAIGVHLYRGLIGSCSDKTLTSKVACVYHNSTWTTSRLGFDNMAFGMSTLFVLGTMDDWFLFLQSLTKIENGSEIIAIGYVTSFILIVSFVMLNVLIGFVISVFHIEKEREEMFHVLEKSSKECILAALSVNPKSHYISKNGSLRYTLNVCVNSNWFHAISFGLIVLNTVLMMTRHYQQSDTMTLVQHYGNIVFTICFTIELIIKYLATTIREFIMDVWNIFDVIVIFGSWVDVILSQLDVQFINLGLLRLFRAARLAKLVSKDENMRQLFATFLKSMGSVPPIAFLLGIILYIYAILGMELFGGIRIDASTAINQNANFQTFFNAVFVLIRVTTLDAWHQIMLDCADTTTKNCQTHVGNCGSHASYVYFVSFVFICSYIMTNLFLAVIMENFVYLTNDKATVDVRHIQRFTEAWNRYDVRGTGTITIENMISLMRGLDPPLGVGCFCPRRMVCSKLMKLHVPIEKDNLVKFKELLLTLILHALQIDAKNELLREDIQQLSPDIDDDLLDRVLPVPYDPRRFNKNEIQFYEQCAADIIIGYYKAYKKVPKTVTTAKDNQLEVAINMLNYSASTPIPICSEKIDENADIERCSNIVTVSRSL